MSDKKLRGLSLMLVAAAGMLAAKPAYACHLATGWCCVEVGTEFYCCYYSGGKKVTDSCGYVD
jgi:hypothetical protein